MTDQTPETNWAEKFTHTLSPSTLAEALFKVAGIPEIKEKSQELYAKAALMSAAASGTALMAEESSLSGKTTARVAAPAYGISRVGPYEQALYKLVEEGKVAEVKSIARPQIFTATTHPNFSRSKEMVTATHALVTALGKLDLATQADIQKTRQLPASVPPKIRDEIAKQAQLIATLSKTSIPREKRSRRDELNETVIDFIPTAMDAVHEQMEIIKKRWGLLSDKDAHQKFTLENPQNTRRAGARKPDGTPKRGGWNKKYDVAPEGGEKEPTQFSSLNQLDAVAALMPQYNSWFADGDGKTTCHVYDAELAIPAIKRKTYEYYEQALKDINPALPNNLSRDLQNSIKTLKEVEQLAANRVEALNAMQDVLANHSRASDEDLESMLQGPTAKAAAASKAYMDKLKENFEVKNGKTIQVKDMLRHENLAAELKGVVGQLLQHAYDHKNNGHSAGTGNREQIEKIEKMETLYVQLASMGNYAVHLERRENARQYNEVLRYLIQSNTNLRTKLADKFTQPSEQETSEQDPEKREIAHEKRIETFMARLRRDQINANGGNGENYFSKAVEEITKSLMSGNDPLEVRKSFRKTYRKLASKLEKSINPGNGEELVTEPLERRELLTLDALGYFNMAHLYPEAMKGGFVVAEYAQPANALIDKANAQPSDQEAQEAVKKEVERRSETEMLTQMAFAMGMQKTDSEKSPVEKAEVKPYRILPEGMPIMPLHEDPATLEYISQFQKNYRDKDHLLGQYLLDAIGIGNPDTAAAAQLAEAKAVKYIDTSANRKQAVDKNGLKLYADKNGYAVTEPIQEDGTPNKPIFDDVYETKKDAGGKDMLVAKAPEIKKLTAYQELRRNGYDDEMMKANKLDVEALKNTFVLEGPPDMEACSDNSKRATIIGAELAEQSVREKLLAAAKHPVEIGEEGNKVSYMIKKPKYLGQGGSIQRATESPLDSVQATLQGSHQANFVPRSLAHKVNNYLLGRLFLKQEAALGNETPAKILELAGNGNFNAGNLLGLPGHVLSKEEKDKMNNVISDRVRSTLGDDRYKDFMEKYCGEKMPNYSARADSKGSQKGFSEERAIGMALKEWFAGTWSNIVGMAALFDFPHPKISGENALRSPDADAIKEVQKWMKEDYSLQQRLMASGVAAIAMDPAQGWERGGITYKNDNGHITLTKSENGHTATVTLGELVDAYENKHNQRLQKYKKDEVTFDKADLVKAHLTRQVLNLESGLKAVYKKDNLIDIFDPAQRPRLQQIRDVNHDIAAALRDNALTAANAKDKDKDELENARNRLKAAYYEMFEGGGNLLFPLPKLMEQNLHKHADAVFTNGRWPQKQAAGRARA